MTDVETANAPALSPPSESNTDYGFDPPVADAAGTEVGGDSHLNTAFDSSHVFDDGELDNAPERDVSKDYTYPGLDDDAEEGAKEGEGDKTSTAESKTGEEEAEVESPEWLTDELSLRAEQSGFTTEGMRQFHSAEALDATLAAQDKRWSDMGQRGFQEGGEATPAARESGDRQTQYRPAEVPADEDGFPAKYKLDLDVNDLEIDPKVIAQIHAMNDHYHARASRMERAVQQHATLRNEEQTTHFIRDFDGWVKTIEPEWHQYIGEKPCRSYGPSDPINKMRGDITAQMTQLSAGMAHSGIDPRSIPFDELANRAARIVLGDKVNEMARSKVHSQLRDRAKKAIGRPTHRKGRGASPEERAIDFSRKFMRDHGQTAD